MAGVELLHVPYKGSAKVVFDLVGGQIDMVFLKAGAILPQIQSEKERALALRRLKRSMVLPERPTLSETFQALN